MELKLTGITLNRFKNHIGKRIRDKGVQVGILLLKTRWLFKIEEGICHFFPIQILIISPLRNGRRDAQITTLTQRSRPISAIELAVPVRYAMVTAHIS